MNKFRSVFFLSFLCVGSQVGFSSDDQVAQLSGADMARNKVTTSLIHKFQDFPDFSVQFNLTRPQIDALSPDNGQLQRICSEIGELFEERYVQEVAIEGLQMPVSSQVGFSSDDQVAQLSVPGGADVVRKEVTTSLIQNFPNFSVQFNLTRPQIDALSTDNTRIQFVCSGIRELFEERYIQEVTADEQLKKNFIIQKMFSSNPDPEQLTKSLLQLEQEYKVFLSNKRARDIIRISATTYKNIFNHEMPDELKQALKMMSSYRFGEWYRWLGAAHSARDAYKTNHDGAVPPAAWLQRMERSTLIEASFEDEKQGWIYEAMGSYPRIPNGQAYPELTPEWQNTLQRMDGMDTKDAKAEAFKIIKARERRQELAILASREDHNKSDIY